MKILAAVLDNLFVRLGTFLSAFFVGYGVSEEHSVTLAGAAVMIVGVVVDLATDFIRTKFSPAPSNIEKLEEAVTGRKL